MTAFKQRFVIDIYAMALKGCNERTIAKEIGFSSSGFVGLKKRKKGVRYALKRAKEDRESYEKLNLPQYVSGQLPKHLKDVWDKITEYGRDTTGYGKIEKLLGKESRRARQELLVYAILISGFNISKALRKVAIPRNTFLAWAESDPDFVELLNEVEQIKKDFFEDGLINLVKAGDSPAIIHTAKTLNRDRGYGDVTETHVSGLIGVATLNIGELGLPPEVLRIVLNAVQAKEQNKLPAGVSNIIKDAVQPRKQIEAKVK